jgi:hypothetical protein
MPLVPTSIIQQWYRRDHPIYRSFAFLFENPLWSKAIPKGFTICPFFWLATLSFFVVRPFVYVVVGLRTILRWMDIGGYLKKTITFTDKTVAKIVPLLNVDDFFFPTFGAVMFSFMIAMFCYGGWQLASNYIHAQAISLLLIPLALAITLIVCVPHKGTCNTAVYTRIATPIAVAAVWYLHTSEFATVVHAVFVLAPKGIVHHLSSLGMQVFNIFRNAFFTLGHDISHGFTWLFHALVDMVMACAVTIGALIVFAIVGYFFMKLEKIKKPATKTVEKDNKIILLDHAVAVLAKYIWERDDVTNISQYSYAKLIAKMPEVKVFVNRDNLCDTTQVQAFEKIAREKGAILHAEIQANLRMQEIRQAHKDAMCKAVTSKLALILEPFAIVFSFVFKWIKKIVLNIAIFFVYMWTLVKARKQGACPYFKFTDAPTNNS